jgi:hypothetical protein
MGGIDGRMGEFLMENGNIIKWMGKVCLLGRMGEFMKGSIKMISKEGQGVFTWPDKRKYVGKEIWGLRVI